MARVRRKTAAASRLNFELAGIAALGFAVLLGIAIVLPAGRSGAAGGAAAYALRTLFGGAAGAFPCLIALIAVIVFLEINVPKMIATLGSAAVGFFIIIDAALGPSGGALGRALDGGLTALVGDVGEKIVLAIAALSIAVWITNVSVKKVIGWCIARLAALRVPRVPAPRSSSRSAAATQPAGPRTLREAFHLPALLAKPSRAVAVIPAAAAAAATATASRGAGGVATAAPAKTPYDVRADDEEFVEDPDAEEDDEYEDEDEELEEDDEDADEEDADDELDEEDDDEELDDEDEEPDDEDEELDDDEADEEDEELDEDAPAVDGEYEPAGSPRAYKLPDLSIFDAPQAQHVDESNRATILEDTLASFGVGAKVVHIERGPSITRYELRPERGVKISRISALTDDLALALAATSVRIEAPIPGKSAVGIEVPNATVSIVAIREILEALPQRGTVPPLNMALGKDITGRVVFGDLGKMPHLLVAGATGRANRSASIASSRRCWPTRRPIKFNS